MFDTTERLKIIGEGRTSKVYISNDLVVKKVEKLLARKEEIDVLKTLTHPSIVKLVDSFEDKNYVYIIMEYCPGKDLYEWRHELGEKQSNTMDDIINQLIDVIKYMHGKNVIHGDLTVVHTIINKNKVKIIDFGNCKRDDEDVVKGTEIYGTFPFLSPEMLSGEVATATKAGDLWALGVLIFIAITGDIPFSGHNISSISLRIRNSKINYENIPKKYIKLLKSLLHKKYHKRKLKN